MSARTELQKQIDRVVGIPLVLLAAAIRACVPSAHRTRARPARPQRILLIKLWGLGNLTMILPIARRIKACDPEVEIDLLTLEQNREFAIGMSELENVHTLDPQGFVPAELLSLARRLRNRRYDLVLDFEQFLRASALLTYLARPAYSVGFATPRQWRHHAYDAVVPLDPHRHMLYGFRAIAREGGIDIDDRPERYVPRAVAASRRVRARMHGWRHGSRPLVVLHVGSGDNFIGRRWPTQRFARFADLAIARFGAEIVFTGTRHEVDLVAEARRAMLGPSVDFSGRLSTIELIELIAQADLVVSNDTAPVHFAAALGVPQIAIYGPNTPRLYGPLSERARVLYRALSCSPCITNTNAKTSFCGRPLCVRTIDPVDAIFQAQELLRSRLEPRIAGGSA